MPKKKQSKAYLQEYAIFNFRSTKKEYAFCYSNIDTITQEDQQLEIEEHVSL